MTQRYQVVSLPDSPSALDPKRLAQVLAQDGQLLLPMLDLIENAQVAIDDLIDVMGRATIEAVLLMSAAQVAGPKQQGKKTDRDVAYHGSQPGRVALKERQLRVTKPRLRKKAARPGEAGEVEIPAYEAMRKDGRLADRMLEILIAGVSTRRYQHVLPEMAETVGVSKSEVSRETIEAGERLLKELAERDLSGLEILAVWIDGIQLGPYHVICAVGVDAGGHKHVLGLREGATENAVVATALLEDLVASRPRSQAAVACSSSTGRRPCAVRSTRSSARISRSSDAGTTSFATSWATCPRTSTSRPRRRSVRRSSWTRRRGRRSSSSTRPGWSTGGRMRRRPFEKVLERCSQSTAWGCRACSAAAWGRRTSSTTGTRRPGTGCVG